MDDWDVASQDDADMGAAMQSVSIPTGGVRTDTGGGFGDWLGKVFSSDPGGFAARTPASSVGIGTGLAWDRVLNQGLSAWLTKEQIDANKQLLLAGRSVGYNPALTTLNQPQSVDSLVRLALMGGLIYGVIRIASKA